MSGTGITVLLATWQGGRFLDEQLRSLREQAGPPVSILARDDGSSDDTVAILDRWSANQPDWLERLPGDGVRRGAVGNFAALLAACRSSYGMFCDQDDRWHADKVARSFDLLQGLERIHGADTPILVHGDARLIDAEGCPLPGTLAGQQHHRLEDAARPEREVMHNHVTGCTTMFNRALIDLAVPVPEAAIWHDWWLGLIASTCGVVAVVPGLLLDYRQHGGNAVGAGAWRWSSMARRLGSVRDRTRRVAAQASAVLERCHSRLDGSQKALLEACAALPSIGWFSRRRAIAVHGMWMPGWVRNAALLAGV